MLLFSVCFPHWLLRGPRSSGAGPQARVPAPSPRVRVPGPELMGPVHRTNMGPYAPIWTDMGNTNQHEFNIIEYKFV